MIQSKEELKEWIEVETGNYLRGNWIKRFALQYLVPDPIYLYIKTLRKCEYLHNCPTVCCKKIRTAYYDYKLRKLQFRTGVEIQINTVDKGLCIHHHGGVIINGGVRIGKNCNIRPFTVIGNKSDKLNSEVPIIGDNVNIGANVTIIGNIKIGNNVIIGAGSVVVNNISDNTVVVGNPAHII